MRSFAKLAASAALAGALLAWSGVVAYAAEADVGYAKDQIAKFKEIPPFEAPGPAFDAKACMAGKKVLTILNNSTNPFLITKANAMKEAASEVGFVLEEWTNQGQPQQWAAGINYAINNDFDLIDLAAVDPGLVVPQLRQAKEAGIIVKTGFYYDASQEPHEVLDGTVPFDYATVGRLVADWIVAQSGGGASVLVLTTKEFLPTAPYVAAFEAELSEHCSDCKTQSIDIPGAEWTTKTQPAVQTALLANPEIDYVFPIYDSMSQFVAPAITLAGKTGQVEIVTFNGTPFVLDMVRDAKVQMDVGQSLGWAGRAVIDSHMRSLCGLEIPAELNAPVRIFDETNIEEVGVPAAYDKGFGDAYVREFRRLWGVEK